MNKTLCKTTFSFLLAAVFTFFRGANLAAENFRLYTKNRRSWTIITSENFGKIAQIEVGAFSVGGIKNRIETGSFKKGEEKGYFDLHGSTIVLLMQKDSIKIRNEIETVASSGEEYRVKIGEYIAEQLQAVEK